MLHSSCTRGDERLAERQAGQRRRGHVSSTGLGPQEPSWGGTYRQVSRDGRASGRASARGHRSYGGARQRAHAPYSSHQTSQKCATTISRPVRHGERLRGPGMRLSACLRGLSEPRALHRRRRFNPGRGMAREGGGRRARPVFGMFGMFGFFQVGSFLVIRKVLTHSHVPCSSHHWWGTLVCHDTCNYPKHPKHVKHRQSALCGTGSSYADSSCGCCNAATPSRLCAGRVFVVAPRRRVRCANLEGHVAHPERIGPPNLTERYSWRASACRQVGRSALPFRRLVSASRKIVHRL